MISAYIMVYAGQDYAACVHAVSALRAGIEPAAAAVPAHYVVHVLVTQHQHVAAV
jgi:hypothetical protein